jgi:hypothetical protein
MPQQSALSEPADEADVEKSTPGKYVQIGDVTPINGAQRQLDMDDIMNAVAELEKESSFSSGKVKPNLRVFDKQGKAVDNEELLSTSNIEKPSVPVASMSEGETEALAEKILAVYEKQEILNGGVLQLKKLKELLESDAGSPLDAGKFTSTIEVVRSMGMISNIIDLGRGDSLVLFKELDMTADEVGIIQLAINMPLTEFTKENIVNALGVPEDVVLGTLKKMQEKGIMRFSGKSILVPGVIQP